jgi:site-specific DNA-methyltransferase (adenine-specific)
VIEIDKIYNGNYLDIIKNIDNDSIDMILTDPPYNITQAGWDKEIDLDEMWGEFKRVIKDKGAILIFSMIPFSIKLGMSNFEMLRYEWIWEKTQATGFYNARKMPMKAHENILVFYKNLPVYNPQKTEGHKPINSYHKKAEVQNKTTVYGKTKRDIIGGGETDRFPRDVIVFSSDKQKTKLDGTIHPTQKPIALCEYLISTYTNESDLVLDCFCGSGSICVASKKLKRRFIGIDIIDDFCKISERRLKEVSNE